MRRFTLRQRLRYRFDDMMSRGTLALIGGLSAVTLATILAIAVIVYTTGIAPAGDAGASPDFSDLVWMCLMRMLDAGTMGGDTGSWAFLLSMLAVTFGGIFILSTLIGILSSGIESRLDDLRKGRSLVLEEDHTVLLGWSPQVFSVISELAAANENKPRATIAVLAEQDKVEMEDEIRDKVPDLKTTRVVCRSGSPTDLVDLEIVNPHDARSIVILSGPDANSDAHVIKTILALTNNPNRRKEPYHIVAAVRDPRNAEVARMVGRDEAQIVVVGDMIARITAQTCRQTGLSSVFTELLDFGGDEIYFTVEPKLVGKTFGDAIFAYEDSTIIGLRRATGELLLKPPMDTKVQQGDAVVAISEDDDTVRVSDTTDHKIDTAAIRPSPASNRSKERTLILGWNRNASLLATELDCYVEPGSLLTVMADNPEAEPDIEKLRSSMKRQELDYRRGEIQSRDVLDSLDIPSYQHVIVLSDSDRLEVEDADAGTLVTLLHLRDIRSKSGDAFSIVSEMLDVRNRELAEVTQTDDFIVSDRLISLMLSQISENRELTGVFGELFGAKGAKISFYPADDYIVTGKPVNFYTVLESARRRGQVAIGYRNRASADDPSEGVVVNPDKSQVVTLGPEDRVIVLA